MRVKFALDDYFRCIVKTNLEQQLYSVDVVGVVFPTSSLFSHSIIIISTDNLLNIVVNGDIGYNAYAILKLIR